MRAGGHSPVERIESVRARRLYLRAAPGGLKPLAAFIPATTPWLAPPLHLAPLVELIERVPYEPVRAVVTTPPQHGKTTTLLHGIVWLLKQRPERTNAYVSYAAEFASGKSKQARAIAARAGVAIDSRTNRLEEWRTRHGGGMLTTGIGGPLTGHAIDGLLLVDDPVKNRMEAESGSIRQSHWEWFNDVAYTRLHQESSIIVCMTRWHPDDLAGRLIQAGWENLCLPAVSEAGEALWPAKFPVAMLEQIRGQIGEYSWASLYLGQPRPRGGAVFREPTYYDKLPEGAYRQARGFDMAYSRRKTADYSVIISGRYYEAERALYIDDLWRGQVESRAFANVAKGGQGNMHIYAHGTERGVIDMFMRDHRLPIVVRDARDGGDKFSRAQPVAAAWNEGRVRIPANASWLEAFLVELLGFTGVDDRHDDQVDALAALWDGLASSGNAEAVGRRVLGW